MDSIKYLSNLPHDKRLNVWHLAILTAVLQLASEQRCKNLIFVSRSKLMEKSLIRTIPTFHKYFKELQSFGYLTHRPSYHPNAKSTVEIHSTPT